MKARICENSKCYAIQCQIKCFRCKSPTEPLPDIPLYAAGIDGKAHLEHTDDMGYTLVLDLPGGPQYARVPITALLHAAQPHLPAFSPVSGLTVMDTLQDAAKVLRAKTTGHWSGWILYLLELLQEHADPTAFMEVLLHLQADLHNTLSHATTATLTLETTGQPEINGDAQ